MQIWLRNTAVLGWLGLSSLSFAVSEFIPIQERAEGQSLSGAHLLNDSLYSNPASGAFTSAYSVEGIYASPKTFAVSVFDTKTSEVGGGMGYFRKGVPFSSEPVQGFKVSTMGKVSQAIGIGLSGKTLWGPTRDGDLARMYDMDSGVLVNLTPIQLGLTMRNILGGNEKFEAFREMAVGARVNYQDTLFLGTTLMMKWGKWSPYQYGIGAEYVSPYYFSLKGGYRILTEENQSFWSVGGSLLAPNMSLHYAAEIPNQSGQEVEHTLALAFLF